jgi:hypothetical protein
MGEEIGDKGTGGEIGGEIVRLGCTREGEGGDGE